MTQQQKRSVFFLSDQTGITAENLGKSLLSQFSGMEFHKTTLPYINNIEKAQQAVARINQTAKDDAIRPLLFSTLIDKQVREVIKTADGLLIDLFDAFVSTLEAELHTSSVTASGLSHGIGAYSDYKERIDAVNYALNNDDGVTLKNLADADIILIGVSRSGKTPTSLYLALHYGILAANYPLTEEDMGSHYLPTAIEAYRDKLYGLTINPRRLSEIRQERRSESRYSSLEQCKYEVRTVENLFRNERIPYIDTSKISVEEIATTILHETGMKRRL